MRMMKFKPRCEQSTTVQRRQAALEEDHLQQNKVVLFLRILSNSFKRTKRTLISNFQMKLVLSSLLSKLMAITKARKIKLLLQTTCQTISQRSSRQKRKTKAQTFSKGPNLVPSCPLSLRTREALSRLTSLLIITRGLLCCITYRFMGLLSL